MKQYTINSFEELNKVLSRYKKSNLWLFRGQANKEWPLIPKAGRKEFKGMDDKVYFESWQRRAREYANENYSSIWDWLALAQHHGLATRLLDWTRNPLVACFFAVRDEINCDSAIYCYYCAECLLTSSITPFKNFNNIYRIKSSAISQRITRQHGSFTIHNPPTLDLITNLKKKEKLEKIIIKRQCKKELLFDMSFYGINNMTIFPDLDGLSNWHVKNKDYWSAIEEL